jgi:hypothetical protein
MSTFPFDLHAWLRRWACRLDWHDDEVLALAPGRLFLRCVNCGHESPGWTLDAPPPRLVG